MRNLTQLTVVAAFLNTVDHEGGADGIAEPAALRAWLVDHTPFRDDPSSPAVASDDDVAAAAALRDAVRADVAARGPRTAAAPDMPATSAELAEVCSAHPLRLGDTAGDEPPLVPVGGGVRGALGWIAAAVASAQLRDTWSRLKVCPGAGCDWAFVDRSRNCSRRWCDMRYCGNEAKVRAYRTRQRGATRERR